MSQIAASGLPFRKMHGLGNDFVVLDARETAIDLTRDQVRAISDRKFGVGFDQMVTLAPSDTADAVMRIHNWDGGEVETCGNAARCVAWLLMRESGKSSVSIDTQGGLLQASSAGDGLITVDMGRPHFDWQAIPLAREMDTAALDFRLGPLDRPAAVNVGNPHVVFVVPDAEAIDLAALGPKIEHDPLFPERTNVEVVTVQDRGPYQIQAAIVALHARAVRPEDTDWAGIDQLYAALETLQPSPVITLNRAVAVSKISGAEAALALVEPLAERLSGYFHFHGLRGALLMQLGRGHEARIAFDQAIALANTPAEAAHIRQHLDQLIRTGNA